MDPAVQQKLPALGELCTRYGVCRLELFGSSATGGFDASRSDLDFLVEFLPLQRGQHADAYFGLKEELDRTRTALYAA